MATAGGALGEETLVMARVRAMAGGMAALTIARSGIGYGELVGRGREEPRLTPTYAYRRAYMRLRCAAAPALLLPRVPQKAAITRCRVKNMRTCNLAAAGQYRPRALPRLRLYFSAYRTSILPRQHKRTTHAAQRIAAHKCKRILRDALLQHYL